MDQCAKVLGLYVDWYDFDNGYGETNGYFSKTKYNDVISFEGKFIGKKDGASSETDIGFDDFYISSNELTIPTSWLKSPFEEMLKNIFQKYKEEIDDKKQKKEDAKNKEQERIKKAPEMNKIISGKLTPEERTYITFVYKKDKKNKYKRA